MTNVNLVVSVMENINKMKNPTEFIKETYGENWTTKSDWMSGDVFNVMEDYAKYFHNELGGEWEKASDLKDEEKENCYNKLPKTNEFYDIVVKGEILYQYYYNGNISDDAYVKNHVTHYRLSQKHILPLPKDYISTKTNLPDNGETVMIITNHNRNTLARFEMFLGNEIWETDYDFKDNEKVIGWKK